MTIDSFTKSLAEMYYISSLEEAKAKKYWLIQRYEDKVSSQLKKEAEALLKEGETKFGILLKAEMTKWKDVFKKIPISEGFTGTLNTPVPFAYKEEE